MKSEVVMTQRLLVTGVVALVVAAGAAAGEKGTPAEAKALLDKAVAEVQKDGTPKAIAKFNDPAGGFRDRDLYVFCMDGSHKITAHPEESMRGTDAGTLKDSTGKAFGAEMVAAANKGSGTVEYMWKNPASGKVEAKVSYLKKAGDQFCGVGAYK
jgi:single cache domain-containing protein